MFVKVNTSPEPYIAFRVELPNGNYALVPESEEGGADVELQYVEVSKDTEDPQANCADEGKPRCIVLYVFEKLHNYLWMFVHLR
jgi:hypothetical protein